MMRWGIRTRPKGGLRTAWLRAAHEPVSLRFLAPPSTGNVAPSFEPNGV